MAKSSSGDGCDRRLDAAIEGIAAALRSARSVVVMTGAGASAESAIPTFRDTMEGLWAQFDPATLATPQAFEADPELVSRWYDQRRLGCLAAEPNPGHTALVAIERAVVGRGGSFTLLTQNVDGLHGRAGSRRVVELHGSVHRWRCMATGREFEPGPGALERYPPASPFEDGAVLRPGVVWFGEALPESAAETALEVSAGCDVFMCVGTSSVVYPAAGFVELAASAGAVTVEINPDDTPITAKVRWTVRGKSGEVLPKIAARSES